MSHRSKQLPRNRDRRVEIRIRRGYIRIDPVPRGLRPALLIRETRFKGSQPRAGDFEIEPFALTGDTLTVAPGLLSRTVDWLEKHRYQYRVRDQRHLDVVDPRDPEPAAVIDAGSDGELPSVLRGHSHGTMVVTGPIEAVRRIVDVCKCMPTAKIGVVTRNKHLARNLSLSLCRNVDEHVNFQPGSPLWHTTRIRVVPAGHLHAFHGLDLDVLMVLFDHEITSERRMRDLLSLRPAPTRVYALRHDGRLTDAQSIALEAIAGPTIFVSTLIREEAVQLCSSRSFPDLAPARDRASRERIWRHEGRNRWITGIAEACADRNLDMLWAEGLYLRDQEELPNDPSVAILVESTQHGRELIQYLPGWDLQTITGGTRTESPRGRILTLARAAERPFAANIVIVAGNYSQALPRPVHQHGTTLNWIVLADGTYETRFASSKVPATTSNVFPVVPTPFRWLKEHTERCDSISTGEEGVEDRKEENEKGETRQETRSVRKGKAGTHTPVSRTHMEATRHVYG